MSAVTKTVKDQPLVALIAHDKRKKDMLGFVHQHISLFRECRLIATLATGKLINQKTNLELEYCLPGPLGGDQQIGARIALGDISAVIFLRDPLTVQPHEPDVTALLRLCDVHLIPLATNISSAHILITWIHEQVKAYRGDKQAI